MLGCYLSPSQQSACHATRPSPSPTVRIAILSIFRGERCQIGAALAEEPECPVNPQSDPMSSHAMKGTEPHPLQGAANPYGADTLQGQKILLHIHPAAESGISPGQWSKISPELQRIAYCGVFPPRGRRFSHCPAHLIVVLLLG